jgi:hypothetical protein
MVPVGYADQAPVPPPAYHRGVAAALHLDALTLVRRRHLLALCRQAVGLARRGRRASTLRPAPIHDRLSLTAAPMSRASVGRGCILRAPGRPVDLERYALREGPRVDQVKRYVRAGVGE